MSAAYQTCPAPGGRELTARALTLAGLRRHGRVLDIGCGSGGTVDWLRRCHRFQAFGLDCSRARFQTGVPLLQAQAERLPFASATLDGVLAECSLSVTASQDAALAECARVLVRGGKLLLTDVYARNPVVGMIQREELMGQLAAHDFRVLCWEDHSEVLRTFLARYIFEHGSTGQLWAGPCGPGEAVQQVRPGYFLLVAEAQGAKTNGR